MATIVAGDMYQKLDGQLFEIKRQIRQPGGYPFDPEQLSIGLQAIIEGRFGQENKASVGVTLVKTEESRPRIEILHETPKPCISRTADEQVAGMRSMFGMLGWIFTESGLIVPERREGFDRLIVSGDTTLTNNRAFDACKASFPSWRYSDDLDSAVPVENDQRHPSRGIYAIWVRDVVEADEELKNLSADQIAKKEPKLKTITLLERELLELVNFMETGKPLDVKNWTLCSGSRDSGGGVPGARWDGDEFGVGWGDPDDRGPRLRAREVVSL